VQVFWEQENQVFTGTISNYNMNTEDYCIHYDDGIELWGHLLEDFDFIDSVCSSNEIDEELTFITEEEKNS